MRLKGLVFAGLVGASILPTSQVMAAELVGVASVIDGDTIEIQGERIRLNGIDAPESRQTCEDASGAPYRCGTVSANALAEWLAQSRPTRCEAKSRDRYRRWVALCLRADGASVNRWLVQNGLALDWPRYSKGAYAEAQTEAQAHGRGIWQGRFELPWEWRKR